MDGRTNKRMNDIIIGLYHYHE